VKRPVVVALLALVASVATASVAETPPSVWDRAKDPAVTERYRLHRRVQELMHPPGPTNEAIRTLLRDRARAELEMGSAATSPDVRLRFDLGEVYEELKHYEQSIAVLEPALALSPRENGAAEAWLALAFSAAHLDRSRQERDAYDAYLALVPDGHSTLNVLSNRAESEMRLGELDEAVAGYRDVIDRIEHSAFGQGGDLDILVLARWGLAVALDRSGNPADAEHEALIAAKQDPAERIIGDQESVFFVPDYERDWYYALGRTQHAKQATDPRLAAKYWSLVVRTWADYLQRAAPTDRWVALAKAHLGSAQVEQRRADARLAAAKKKGLPADPTPIWER